jgi:murein DD-endopeptidase MepM/ murein hydrolase activator NlpD
MNKFSRIFLGGLFSIVSVASIAQTVEFSQIYSATFRAPLGVRSNGFSYVQPAACNTTTKPWSAIPSIRFDTPDDKGTTPSCSGQYPMHLGTDYAGPAGGIVYAIADGYVKRSGYYTTTATGQILGDGYVVVESGSSNKWTATYGHLVYKSYTIGQFVKKGDPIGTLFNFTYAGDVPHLHLSIHKGLYDGTNTSVRGFACKTDPKYVLNRYDFISPEPMKFETYYY